MVTIYTLVHPGTATLVFTSIQIKEELTDGLALSIFNLVEADAVIPSIDTFIDALYSNVVKFSDNFEQATNNTVISEIWFCPPYQIQ